MAEQDDTTDSPDAAEHWGESAKAWASREEPEAGAQAKAAAWMLEAAAIKRGEHVLELACGAGTVGLQAAELVGSSGVVVCSDFSEPMVQEVRERIKELDLKNVEAWILDATKLRLDGVRFHAVLCRFGYMLLNDPLAALRQGHDALRSEGRLALAVWGTPEKNLWLSTILNAVIGHFGAAPPAPGTPGPFALGDPKRVAALLEEAGFVDPEVSLIDGEQRYESLDAWWEEIREISGPLSVVLGSLPEADVAAIRKQAQADAAEYVDKAGAVVFPAQVVGARAVRPRPEPVAAEAD